MIQLQVLNHILDTKDMSLVELNNLSDEFFSDYIEEYHYIKNHFDEYKNVPDKLSFLDKFPNFDIIEVRQSDKYLIEQLYKDRNKRKLAVVFNKIRNLINDDKIDQAVSLYTNAQNGLQTGISMESVDIFKDTSRYQKYIDRCNDFSKYYIKTGFKELDEIIGGWDRNQELATIAARTNQGKSWLLLKFAISAAEQGLKCGVYSGEMSETKVGYRVDTLISHISNNGLIHGNSDLQNDYKRYIDELPTKYKGNILVLTPAMINGPATVSALRSFVEKEKLDILFIDQHSLLEDDQHAKNPVERAANISKALKNLQVLKHLPIISVSQQNRNSTENGVGTEHIAQSDRIAQDSTIILFFEQKDGILTLNIVKSRDSVAGKKLHYALDFDHGVFDFMPTENDAVGGKGADELKKQFDGQDQF